MLSFNQRSLLFVIFICIGSIVAGSFNTDVYVTSLDELESALRDYFICLLEVKNPGSLAREEMATYPKSVCGTANHNFSKWNSLYYSIYWAECLGILPLVVYRLKGKVKKGMGVAMLSVRNSLVSRASAFGMPTPEQSSSSDNDWEMIPVVGAFVDTYKTTKAFCKDLANKLRRNREEEGEGIELPEQQEEEEEEEGVGEEEEEEGEEGVGEERKLSIELRILTEVKSL